MSNLSYAFNGTISQPTSNSASLSEPNSGQTVAINAAAGQNYSAGSPASYKIAAATIFPSTNAGLVQFVQYAHKRFCSGSNYVEYHGISLRINERI